ncbi:hypothetical protein [Bradyrhizobium sp. 87]|uniref:hypothetical protein n=1 Tax=Bradyrhizobium sp. 87 TaxID=2782682 RepID=UPI001FF759D9|nr:hypothetical protein [Bradyrhizobium sp. 87]MCK1425815.1 hypothetical protein [Bradyrhizobium sp. 87]
MLHVNPVSTQAQAYRQSGRPTERSVIKVLAGLSNVIADARGRIGSTDVNPFLLTAEHGVAVDAPVVLRNLASKSA